MPEDKRLVYVLKSANPRARYYIGLTRDVRARLADHNAGRCPHTARYRPWQLHVSIELPDEQRALAFERYLKSGSGPAFANLEQLTNFAERIGIPAAKKLRKDELEKAIVAFLRTGKAA